MVSLRGIPDYLICIDEQFLAIELKSGKDARRNPLQEFTLEAIAAAGGIGLIVFPENWKATQEFLREMIKEGDDEDDDFELISSN